MPDPTHDSSFTHFHNDALKDLKLLRASPPPLPSNDHPPQPAHQALTAMCTSVLDDVIREVGEATEPEKVFRASVMALRKVEDMRHLMVNLLEAVKRGDSLQDSLTRLHEADLIDGEAVSIVSRFTSPEKRNSPPPSTAKAGKFIRKLLSYLTDFALALMQVVMNAITAIPRFAALKVKPNIGLAGLFPTFSVQVDLEAHSVSLYEFLEALKGT